MPFVYNAEDGSGLSEANSYFEIDSVEAAINNLDSTEWDANSDEDKQKTAVRVTRFFEERFRFYGESLTSTQALQWPRTKNYDNKGDIIDPGTMPPQLLDAFALVCTEFAKDNSTLEFDTLDRAGDPRSWSTDGLTVGFGSSSRDPHTGNVSRDQLYGTKFVQIEVLLRSIGEIKDVDWVTSNRQSVVR